MKKFKSILSAMLMAIVMIGCQEKGPEIGPEPTPNVRLDIETVLLEVPAEGGEQTVKFTVDRQVQGQVATASANVAWIKDISVKFGREGSVSFVVDAYKGDAPRDAKVEISYAGVKESFVVRQTQPYDWGALAITINDVTDGKVIYTVDPDNRKLTYISMVAEKKTFDDLATDDARFKEDMKYFQAMAEANKLSLYNYLQKILQKDRVKAPVEGLKPGTAYYAYAYGLDAEGNRLTPIYKQEFTTYSVELVDYSFNITYAIEGSVVEMTVEPQDNTTFYMFDVAPAGTPDKDIIKGMEAYIEKYISMYAGLGVSAEEAVRRFAKQGVKSFTYNGQLSENTEYIGYAMAITNAGNIKSRVVTKPFRTGAVSQSKNKISLSVSEIGTYNAVINVTTTTDDLYIIGYDLASNWVGKDNEQILSTLVAGYDWKTQDCKGNTAYKMTGLTPDTEYSVFAFGYAGGKATTKLVRIDFRTKKAGTTTSGATINLTYDKYFLGDDLIKAYPDKFTQAVSGCVVVKVFAHVEGAAEHYYQIYNGDKVHVSDAEFVKSLVANAEGWSDSYTFTPPVGQAVTLAGVAMDANGAPGKVFKKAITFTKEGASPASEFVK